MRRPSPHHSPLRSNTSAPSYHAHKKRKTGGSSAVLTRLVNPFKLAKYNQATFWALFVLGQQILSQVCSLIVLSASSKKLLFKGEKI